MFDNLSTIKHIHTVYDLAHHSQVMSNEEVAEA